MSLTSDTNDGYFKGRLVYIFENISFSNSNNVNCFRQICRRIKTQISSAFFGFFFTLYGKPYYSQTLHRWHYIVAHVLYILDN